MTKIRILGVPSGLGAGHARGDEHDWDVRTDRLTNVLRAAGFEVEDCGIMSVPYPSGIGSPHAKYLAEIVEVCARVSEWAMQTADMHCIPLLIGGDHSIAVGSIAGVSDSFRRRGDTIGVIWLDAHADMNTPGTSPSGKIHGMALAPCVGMDPVELMELRGFFPKAKPQNVVVVGAREIDHDEVINIAKSGITILTMRDIDEHGMAQVMRKAIQIASKGTAGIHVSVDVDVLDPSVAPAVTTPVPGGLTYRETHLALEILADSGKLVSMDLVEYNPALDRSETTEKIAGGLVASALGKSILPRSL